jgi:hypothetical protein
VNEPKTRRLPATFLALTLTLAAATALAQSEVQSEAPSAAPSAAPPAAPPAAPALPELSIALTPGGLDADGDPSWVDVSTRVSGVEWAAHQPFLRIPVKFAGVPAVAYGTDDLDVRDAAGAVPLEESEDDPDAGGFLYFRRWRPARDTSGDIRLSYRAPIGNYVPTLGAGPPFDLRAQDGGLSGAFNTFLVVPDSEQPFLIGIDWDLEHLADGSIAVSSFGEGATRAPGPSDRLIATYLMAGPLGRYRTEGDGPDFTGYWLGNPRFDAAAVLAWSERAYAAIAGFFQQGDPPPYRVLMRGNPYAGGGGAALMGSYLLSFPDTLADAERLRETIAHETVHNWISSIGGPPGSTSWFSEGMTVAYTRRLLLRSGLFTPAEFLDSINDTALGYYTNALNTLPNDGIAAGFWRDTRIRSLPYARGSLYFAAVDAAAREHSGGARSLDDLLQAFLARSAAGEEVTGETWREIVVAELGQAGGDALDAMLAGTLVVPPSAAFGPCFQRRATALRRFELGFDRAALVAEPRIVSGLVKGSAAAQAGLANGDEILHPVALEEAQSKPDVELELQVRRDGRELTIEYLPRGETVDGWLWERVAGVPDTGCAL